MKRGCGIGCVATAFAVALAGSCSDEPRVEDLTGAQDTSGIQIIQLDETHWQTVGLLELSPVPSFTVGAQRGPDPEILFRVSGGSVLTDGRIVILDGGRKDLRFYDPDGEMVGVQGREGEGPGEYRQPTGLWPLPGDSLVVWDRKLKRVTIVGPDGTVARDARLSGRSRSTEVVGVFADGSLIVFRQRMAEQQESKDQQFPGYYSRYSPSGDSLHALGEFPWRRLLATPPATAGGMQMVTFGFPIFDAPTEVAASPDGFWVGTTKRNEVLQISKLGEVERIIRWTGPDRTVTDAVKEAYYDELRARRAANPRSGEVREPSRGVPFADALPSHGKLVARSDGGLLIEEFNPPGSEPSNGWRVLGPTGELEGRLELPLSSEVLWAGPERILLLERDELDVEFVRLYYLEEG